MNNVRFIIQASKGLIRDQRARRFVMYWNLVGLLLLIFVGSTLLWTWLREHPLFFIGYWGLCAWLTVLSILLALYDMAKIRLDAKRARRELERELVGKDGHENPPRHD